MQILREVTCSKLLFAIIWGQMYETDYQSGAVKNPAITRLNTCCVSYQYQEAIGLHHFISQKKMRAWVTSGTSSSLSDSSSSSTAPCPSHLVQDALQRWWGIDLRDVELFVIDLDIRNHRPGLDAHPAFQTSANYERSRLCLHPPRAQAPDSDRQRQDTGKSFRQRGKVGARC